MAAAHTGIAMAFARPAGLRTGAQRVVLLAGILAIIAGILGMHVVTATHAGHVPAAAETAGVNADSGSPLGFSVAASPEHGTHQQTATPAARPVLVPRAAHSALAVAPVCSASGHDAPGAATMPAGCVLATGNTALAAPLPGTARLVSGNGPPLPGTCTCSSSYVPGSPSPGELSISRT